MPQFKTKARVLFESIVDAPDPLAVIRGMVRSTEPVFEDEVLEFKCAPQVRDRGVQEDWSTALAGFANTSGGVLIWGIKCRKDETSGVDCADGFCHVEAAALKTRLAELHLMATDPPVLGVEIVHFDDPEANGRGFVVCYVPQSDARPHRAEKVTNTPYYLRVGSSFSVAPVSMLRDLFSPRLQPYLWVEARMGWEDTGPGHHVTEHYKFIVHNNGYATAHDVYIVATFEHAFNQDLSLNHWLLVNGVANEWGMASKHPIHPGTHVSFLNLRHIVPSEPDPGRNRAQLTLRLFATNYSPQFVRFNITPQHVLTGMPIRGLPKPYDTSRVYPKLDALK